MGTRRPHSAKGPQDKAPTPPEETQLEDSGEVLVEHYDAPPAGPPDKRIHQRKPLRKVPASPEKPERSA